MSLYDLEMPLLTSDLPGIGGQIKLEWDDFRVEEIPAYPCLGEGEYLYLWVEKRGLAAEQLTSHLARELKVSHQDVSMAGMKDRHAVTRQWVCVPAKCAEAVQTFKHEQIDILDQRRHRNKLRTGHLRGNMFDILIRNPRPGAFAMAAAIAQRLKQVGVPNYFGLQRFGSESETLELGLELLRGTKTPADIPRARRRFLLRLALSSAQSLLFNAALARRLREGLLTTVLDGDVMQVAASGGPFVADDIAREQERCDAGETLVSGPLYGPKMRQPARLVAEREAELLARYELVPAHFEKFDLTPGTRRPYLIRVPDLEVTQVADGIRVHVTLPSGSYATVLLAEIQKG